VKHDFLEIAKQHNHQLKQRNRLLRTKQIETLSAWDKKLVECGIIITREREAYIQALETETQAIAQALIGDLSVEIKYRRGWDQNTPLGDSLLKARAKDIQFGYTTIGAHKSDFLVLINKRKAQDYLSRGQMKLLVLALYLAQIKVMNEGGGKSFCVLLDDLAAELDGNNFEKVMQYLKNQGTQIFITTTNKGLFLRYIDGGAKVFHVKQGAIQLEDN
jgi:DNA replication and repair protein RecF